MPYPSNSALRAHPQAIKVLSPSHRIALKQFSQRPRPITCQKNRSRTSNHLPWLIAPVSSACLLSIGQNKVGRRRYHPHSLEPSHGTKSQQVSPSSLKEAHALFISPSPHTNLPCTTALNRYVSYAIGFSKGMKNRQSSSILRQPSSKSRQSVPYRFLFYARQFPWFDVMPSMCS